MGERSFLRLDEDEVHGPEVSAPSSTLGALPVRAELRRYLAQVQRRQSGDAAAGCATRGAVALIAGSEGRLPPKQQLRPKPKPNAETEPQRTLNNRVAHPCVSNAAANA